MESHRQKDEVLVSPLVAVSSSLIGFTHVSMSLVPRSVDAVALVAAVLHSSSGACWQLAAEGFDAERLLHIPCRRR